MQFEYYPTPFHRYQGRDTLASVHFPGCNFHFGIAGFYLFARSAFFWLPSEFGWWRNVNGLNLEVIYVSIADGNDSFNFGKQMFEWCLRRREAG